MAHAVASAVFLLPAAWQLIRIHPYELSYYNELIGGPRKAWRLGLELSYWYDAFTPEVIREVNRRLPEGAAITFPSGLSAPIMVVEDLQSLKALRGDLVLGVPSQDAFPYFWLLTHDSKAEPFTRLLFQMTPWYASRPRQLDGARVATVADPLASSRAWALQLLADGGERRPWRDSALHERLRGALPWLYAPGFDDRNRVWVPALNEMVAEWARNDPDGLVAAARELAAGGRPGDRGRRLEAAMRRHPRRLAFLLRARPEALVEAAEIYVAHPEQVHAALLREPFTEPESLGGYLDRDLAPRGDGS